MQHSVGDDVHKRPYKEKNGRMSWTGPSNMVELFHGLPFFFMCLTIFKYFYYA